MISLRRQLMLWLLPVYVLAALLAALINYVSFGRTLNWFMDNQLRTLVEARETANVAAPIQPLTTYQIEEKGAVVMQIWNADGQLLSSSLPGFALQQQPSTGFHNQVVHGKRWKVFTSRSGTHTVQGAQSLQFRGYVVFSQMLHSGLPILLLIPVTGLLVWVVLRLVLRRLEFVSKAATERNEHNLTALPSEHAPAEIRPLVEAVNRLLARLAEAFDVQRRFVQDAAHELRTPLTALSLQLENVKAHTIDSQVAAQLTTLETGVARMKRLTEQLLRLARQEAPLVRSSDARIDLCGALREIIEELLPLAERRDIDIGLHSARRPIVRANAGEIHSVFHNLIDNALRYSPRGGTVEISIEDHDGTTMVRVTDEGPGIAEDLLPRVFDRFFRIEGSDVEGSGLGLAIAKNAASRNGAQVTLQNRGDRSGLVATVHLHSPATVKRESEAEAGVHGDFPVTGDRAAQPS
jgi:two-component system, OmpR family, sensor kinase